MQINATEGERVRHLRKAKSLTMDKFGAVLGVGKTAISKIEHNENALTPQMAKAICREFNVSETWLRAGEGEMYRADPDDDLAAVLARYKLPPELGDLVRRYGELPEQTRKDIEMLFRDWARGLSTEEAAGGVQEAAEGPERVSAVSMLSETTERA